MGSPSTALVLSGGGIAGGAWMTGIVSGLSEQGVDLGGADLIVGTSAGARVGSQLATGVLSQMADTYRRSGVPAVKTYAALPQFVAAAMQIAAATPGEPEAARRVATMEPLGEQLASDADRRQIVAAQLPVLHWPRQRLLIVAVDAESGRRVAFDADSGVELLDAVMASSALPGIYPLVEIDGRRYADGGVHSLYSADLAAGHDVVIVFSPIPLNDYLRAKLDAEINALGSGTTHVVIADKESLAAIGADAMSDQTAQSALDAGAAQAHREIKALQAIWPTGTSRAV